jgi:hypothetical protein
MVRCFREPHDIILMRFLVGDGMVCYMVVMYEPELTLHALLTD